MTTQDKAIQDIILTLSKLKELPLEDKWREDRHLNFLQAKTIWNSIVETHTFLSENLSFLNSYSLDRLQAIHSNLATLCHYYERIINFKGSPVFGEITGAEQENKRIIDKVLKVYDELEPFIIKVNFEITRDTLSMDNVKILQDKIKQAAHQAQETVAEVEDKASKLSSVIGEDALAKYSNEYKKEAEKHGDYARGWLIFMILFWAVGLSVVLGLVSVSIATENFQDALKLSLVKLALAPFFSIAWWLCSKSRNSNKHLQTVNRNKHLCMLTFQQLLEASDSPATKDAIYTLAAQTVFTLGDTGYTKSNNDSHPSMPLINILPQIGDAAD